MKYENSVFPQQKLSSKYKTEEWGERCVDYVVGMFESNGGSGRMNDFDEMQKNYDLYLGIFDEKDLKYVTDPFDQEDGFPAMTHNMNIIKPKIDLLIGEETKRPLRFNAVRTSQNAISDVQERMKSMLVDYVLATSMASYSDEEKQKYIQMINNGEIMPPDKILSFIENDYKDVAESSAYHSLRYLTEKLSMQNEFNKGFTDLLKSATEVHYVAVSNGEPYAERVDPRYFAYDRSPDLEYIEDGDWAARKMILSYTEAYDRLYDKIDEKKLDKLLEMSGATPGGNKYGKDAPAFDYNHVEFKTVSGRGDRSFLDKNTIVVYHATWKSYKKVGFVDYMDENGELQSEVVSENYMATGMEVSIKWDWIIETWEGYRLGDDLYAGIGPVEYQHISAENPNSQKLPYFGTTINDGKSLVSILKPLQYMYIIIWYRLELALARDKGKILTMDITQIPKSMNIDPAKWLHYISSLGINFVNPYEEGWNIPGREGGKPSQFNQMTANDMSMANTIGQYIEIMDKLENMISELSGVSAQRQGSISSNELVGNVERSVQQSSYITEYIFWAHNQVKKNVLRALVNTAKEAWRDSNKTHLQYILNDASRAFITLSDDFFYEDFDIFISDSTKDSQDLQMIKSLYQPAMQNGASILDIAEIMTLDNISEIKTKLKQIEKRRAEMEQQAADAENQRQAQLIELQNQAKSEEMAIRQAELELEKYKIDADNNAKITVAEIGAYKYQENIDQDGDGMPDPIEIANTRMKSAEINANIEDRRMQLSAKQSEIQNKANLESKKIDKTSEIEGKKIKLEEKKLATQLELQKIKDKAALQREKIKASTAIKNKTAGEK